jgi:recombination protein RecA
MDNVLSKKTKLSEVMKAIDKEYGTGTIARASRVAFSHLRRTSSGVFNLDIGIGGGFPKGRIIGIVGDESTCKTSLILLHIGKIQHTCRECLQPFNWYTDEQVDEETGEVTKSEMVVVSPCKCGANDAHVAVFIDAEGSFDPVWAARLGVDVPSLVVVQPEWGQQAVDMVNALIRSGDVDLMAVDSIAHMTPSQEIEASAQDQQVGVLARIINKMMRTIQSGLNSLGMDNPHKPTIVIVNQFREKVGVMYGDPTTWPGGKGQNFAYSILLIMRAGKAIDETGNVGGTKGDKVGREINWHCRKNKTAIPEKKGSYKFFYDDAPKAGYRAGEVNNDEQIVTYGVTLGVITKGGAWYDLQPVFGKEFANPDEKSGKFQGAESLMAYLKANPAKSKEVQDKILHESKMEGVE